MLGCCVRASERRFFFLFFLSFAHPASFQLFSVPGPPNQPTIPKNATPLQFDLLKELVSALQDVERGRPKNLSSLLDEVAARAALKPSAQEAERLRLEVSSLRSEATRLRDRLRVAEEEVDRARRAAGHDVR